MLADLLCGISYCNNTAENIRRKPVRKTIFNEGAAVANRNYYFALKYAAKYTHITHGTLLGCRMNYDETKHA